MLWSQRWQLPINIKKCSFMRIRASSVLNFTYNIDGIDLEHVEHAKILGVTLSKNLSASLHCNNVASIARKRTFLLPFRSSNLATMTSLFKIYVRLLLEYCTPAWSPYLLKDIDQMKSVQRYFTRSLPDLSCLSYNKRLTKLGLQSLEFRRVHKDCNMYLYKMLHYTVVTSFNEMFALRSRSNLSNMSLRANIVTFI